MQREFVQGNMRIPAYVRMQHGRVSAEGYLSSSISAGLLHSQQPTRKVRSNNITTIHWKHNKRNKRWRTDLLSSHVAQWHIVLAAS
jgi:hypothetical protein